MKRDGNALAQPSTCSFSRLQQLDIAVAVLELAGWRTFADYDQINDELAETRSKGSLSLPLMYPYVSFSDGVLIELQLRVLRQGPTALRRQHHNLSASYLQFPHSQTAHVGSPLCAASLVLVG